MNNCGFEIEKKFLVNVLPENFLTYEKKELSQAYISKKPTIRIRKENDEYFLTIKGKGSIKRLEYTLKISKKEYKSLLIKVDGNFINKTRYYIPLEGTMVAELDIYHDFLNGLYTVEVEFNNDEECENFIKPNWFGDDISSDKRYKNTSLSTCTTKFWE